VRAEAEDAERKTHEVQAHHNTRVKTESIKTKIKERIWRRALKLKVKSGLVVRSGAVAALASFPVLV
jgi:hypothetical protein